MPTDATSCCMNLLTLHLSNFSNPRFISLVSTYHFSLQNQGPFCFLIKKHHVSLGPGVLWQIKNKIQYRSGMKITENYYTFAKVWRKSVNFLFLLPFEQGLRF